MTHWIRLGGTERPIAFGYEVAYAYEAATGGNYNALIFRIAEEMTTAAQAMSEQDLMAVAAAVSVKPMTDVVYHGLKYAHRREHLEIDFEVEDVAAWLFSDQTAMQVCVQALFDSLPRPDGADGGGAKKKRPGHRKGSTGRNLSKQPRPSA